MTKVFNSFKIVLIVSSLLFAYFAFAQTGGPTVQFNVGPVASATLTSGGNINISLNGSISLGGGAQIEDAVVFVAYSDTPIDPSYSGSYQEIYTGSSDPFASDFDSGNSFTDILAGFDGGQTYYFLFKTGLNPTPTGFVPDIRLVTVTTPETSDEEGGGGIEDEGSEEGGGGIIDEGGAPTPFIYTTHIENPLGHDFEFIDFLRKLFSNMVKIAIPFLVIFIIYSGFLFVEAQGNEEKLAVAKKNFLYVIIGATLILSAWMIANALKGTVQQIEQDTAYIENIINKV